MYKTAVYKKFISFLYLNVIVYPKMFDPLTAYCIFSGIFVFHVRLSRG